MLRNILYLGITTILFVMLIGGIFLYQIGFFNDTLEMKTIQTTEIADFLYVPDAPDLPDWEVKSVEGYNDQFTSPTCTIYFSNGIELVLSTSHMAFQGMTVKYIPLGTRTITLFYSEQEEIYQYKMRGLYYSFRMMEGRAEDLVVEYIKSSESNPI